MNTLARIRRKRRRNKGIDMATSQLSEVLQHLRRAVLLRDGSGLTDAQLLNEFVSRRDTAALAALVSRHGSMVWGVCRRVLSNHHDAEDAFQATFLVLVRKAAAIASPELLANWLYGVAHQTALKARATAARRKTRERQVTRMPEPAATESEFWHDLQPLLDQELSRLPDKYRVAIVLCDLEGKTRREVAQQLGVPDGTLAARLTRGRVMLAKRLARHGLAVSGGALGMILSQNAASAGVPTAVVSSTLEALSLVAAGPTAAAGMISPQVAGLTEGVLKSMLPSKFQAAVVLLLALGALGIGASALPHWTVAGESPSPVSRSASAGRDDGNLAETVLALEKRIWEAHTKHDVNVFKSLVAEDFAGTTVDGSRYTKRDALAYVATSPVVDPVMKNARVVVLNATSAIVTYEVRYRIASPGGKGSEPAPPRQGTAGWAIRDGRWWCVYYEASLLGEVGTRSKATRADDHWNVDDTWEMDARRRLGKVERLDLKPPKRD
jgi:RNA polymerase sigma factor (sigma-70 family)